MIEVRAAVDSDLERVNEIYNFYVRTSPATFDIDEVTTEGRREWFTHYAHNGPHRVFVAADGGSVIGWASSSALHERKAYETSTVVTCYIDEAYVGRGIGKALYAALFDAIRDEDLHRAYAGISLPNDASIALHRSFGFRQVALYSEQGRKFGKYWDVAWFEKEL